MSDDIVSKVDRIDSRLAKVETIVYGDDQTNEPGLLQEVKALTGALHHQSEAIQRQTTVLWFLAAMMAITIVIVSLAVLL